MHDKELTHLSLFSGIGGLDLAGERAGFRTVGQCEWADYPRAVLEKHWPGLPRWRDIRTLTGESFYEQTGLRTVTVLSGGFPCQPFSTAGKRRGKEDDRYLWPEMLRVIQEIRPRWVFGENVAGLVTMALDTVLSDLEDIGYACQAVVIPACAVDAPHRRDRVAIVAHSMCNGSQTGLTDSPGRGKRVTAEFVYGGAAASYATGERRREAGRCFERSAERSAGVCSYVADTYGGAMRYDSNDGRTSDREIYETVHAGVSGGTEAVIPNTQSGGEQRQFPGRSEAWGSGCCGSHVSHTDNQRFQIPGYEPGIQPVQPENGTEFGGWRTTEPGLGGMADGLPHWLDEPGDIPRIAKGIKDRADRLKCLGNAVVPQWAFPIFSGIAAIERKEIDLWQRQSCWG